MNLSYPSQAICQGKKSEVSLHQNINPTRIFFFPFRSCSLYCWKKSSWIGILEQGTVLSQGCHPVLPRGNSGLLLDNWTSGHPHFPTPWKAHSVLKLYSFSQPRWSAFSLLSQWPNGELPSPSSQIFCHSWFSSDLESTNQGQIIWWQSERNEGIVSHLCMKQLIYQNARVQLHRELFPEAFSAYRRHDYKQSSPNIWPVAMTCHITSVLSCY